MSNQSLENTTYTQEIIEPDYYERMPDILDYLTYIDEQRNEETGEVKYERKRLTPLEKEIYRVMKRAAGKTTCWKDRDELAFQVNCSAGAITNAKRVLSMPFEQLDGKSLISIEKRRLRTYKDDKVINTKPNDVITVHWIWDYNHEFMKSGTKTYKEQFPCTEISKKEAELLIEKMAQGVMNKKVVHKSGAESLNDSAHMAEACGDFASQRAESPGDINHISYNQTTYDSSYYTTDVVQEDDGFFKRFYDYMTELGVFPKKQEQIVKRYPKKYLEEQVSLFIQIGGKRKNNPGGYFLKMLESNI